ncbi:DUF2085 domain-containing protein [Bacillus taeanensis]|uniref:DUF2085 domain-containing protein n=1 Tax=Bacillus taeanensis TaxID=273032 RepID=A0A366XST1_9BACI|nr:DUF2085 domain-containing protein [Bacillus taeanensis]RBW68947.1 hypothetical protein DS031_13475 [Bacillus taeanensis]
MYISALFSFFGRAICHQLPERTFLINNSYLPLCARDTGILIGLFSTLLYLCLFKKYKANQIPTIKNSFILLLLTVPIALDGLTSYMNLRESSNLLRLTTGIPFGVMLPFFLIPMLNFNNQSLKERRILYKKREAFIPFTLAFCLGSLTYFHLMSYILISSLLILTLVFWGTLLTFLLLKPIKSFQMKCSSAVMLCFFILVLLSQLNEMLRSFYLPYLQG